MKMAGFGFETPTFGRRLALMSGWDNVKISDGMCRNALMPGGVDATQEPKLRGGMVGVLMKFENIFISGHPY